MTRASQGQDRAAHHWTAWKLAPLSNRQMSSEFSVHRGANLSISPRPSSDEGLAYLGAELPPKALRGAGCDRFAVPEASDLEVQFADLAQARPDRVEVLIEV